MKNYKVTGGGFYRYVMNNRTHRGRWLRRDIEPKKTEREELTEEEARGVIERNEAAYMKMAGVKMAEY